MRMRVIDCGYVSATSSQAIWYGVAAAMNPEDDPVLTLVNSLEPYVCIGFHQNARMEVDRRYCVGRGIAVLRRRLGGGAVYIDGNQLIFHFIFPRRRAPSRIGQLYPMFVEPVVRTYRDLGINAAYRPINDIQVDGRKIGGTAGAILDRATVLGGMFLFDFDTATMARCLKVPSQKFQDKLHKTLEEYMTSMRRLLPEVPPRELVKRRFLERIADCLDVAPQDSATSEIEDASIAQEVVRLADAGWTSRTGRRFVAQGVKISADTYLAEGAYKAPGGLIRAQLLARDDRIVDIEFSGDFTCHPPSGLASIEESLKGKRLSEADLAQTLAAVVDRLQLELPGIGPEHLVAAIERAHQR
jgi:lipoate-protein ligase A